MAALVRRSKEEVASKVLGSDTRFETHRLIAYKCETREKYADEIKRLWGDISNRVIVIGRFLIYAKETLPHGDYDRMIETDLPFGRSTAHAFKRLAEAVAQYELDDASLPRDYRACYALLTLPADAIAVAKDRGLIAPRTTREMANAYRREVLQAEISPARHALLLNKKSKLIQRIERLQAELAAIDAELGQDIDQEHENGLVIEGSAVTVED